jgi:hypothetical protein
MVFLDDTLPAQRSSIRHIRRLGLVIFFTQDSEQITKNHHILRSIISGQDCSPGTIIWQVVLLRVVVCSSQKISDMDRKVASPAARGTNGLWMLGTCTGRVEGCTGY